MTCATLGGNSAFSCEELNGQRQTNRMTAYVILLLEFSGGVRIAKGVLLRRDDLNALPAILKVMRKHV